MDLHFTLGANRGRRSALVKLIHRQLLQLLNEKWGSIAVLICAAWIAVSLITTTPKILHHLHFGASCHCDHAGEGKICAQPIDAVYTWVNGSDPLFLREMLRYKLKLSADIQGLDGQHNVSESELERKLDEMTSASRYRDNEELRYSLRSVHKHAPWLRHIYIVTNGQVPSWLDLRHPQISVIQHADIFPYHKHLPTFSSPAIEVHLHRIPGLSHQFIYLNDDVLFGQDVWPDDWYSISHGQKIFLTWPIPPCNHGCLKDWVGDGICDTVCNVKSCDFDGGDCKYAKKKASKQPSPWGGGDSWGGYAPSREWRPKKASSSCNPACSSKWVGDHHCDAACKNVECGYDAGDCGLELMKEHMLGVHLDPDNMTQLVVQVGGGNRSMYFNLTSIFPGRVVTAASQTNPKLVTAASISQSLMT
eukprot:CAMPEP_0118946922 /NCGR_PEP_ID=MMETSP1169-20130426/45097_1 /TAXON_ID=36882 /ORGANISM="Pyramimonas obovata, Strain CCMP722" /LENGTH=418 /DNA_ID=CAMNT_0006893023 /DNA_START=105 /DNA_END=1357 /DNA_ORIENTATION=-